jgi:hypothetical protein
MAASSATAFKSDRKLFGLAMEEAGGLRRQEKVGNVGFSQRDYMTLKASKVGGCEHERLCHFIPMGRGLNLSHVFSNLQSTRIDWPRSESIRT